MCVSLRSVLLPIAFLLWPLGAWAADVAVEPADTELTADDECAAGLDGGCGLHALQRRGSFLGGRPTRKAPDVALVRVGCWDAARGSKCWREIHWAKTKGIMQHPGWYPQMTSRSPNSDFQWLIHHHTPEKCPAPCSGTPPATPEAPPKVPEDPPMPEPPVDPNACLCVFDIDRTLTGRQGSAGPGGRCPADREIPDVEDNAYGGGTLVLSEFALSLNETFCSQCYLGLCSHGNADFEYSKERRVLLNDALQNGPMSKLVLKPQNTQWSDEKFLTPFVVYSPDGEKQLHVANIRKWYQRQGINILMNNVFFFDDRADNVLPFIGTGMNARQISCDSRDMEIGNGVVGLCGATVTEVVPEKGVVACPYVEEKAEKVDQQAPANETDGPPLSEQDVVVKADQDEGSELEGQMDATGTAEPMSEETGAQELTDALVDAELELEEAAFTKQQAERLGNSTDLGGADEWADSTMDGDETSFAAEAERAPDLTDAEVDEELAREEAAFAKLNAEEAQKSRELSDAEVDAELAREEAAFAKQEPEEATSSTGAASPLPGVVGDWGARTITDADIDELKARQELQADALG